VVIFARVARYGHFDVGRQNLVLAESRIPVDWSNSDIFQHFAKGAYPYIFKCQKILFHVFDYLTDFIV